MSAPTPQGRAARDGLINIRIATDDRDLIDRAARLRGKSRSEFVLDAARGAAHEALLDQNVFLVSAEELDRFKAMLDEPVAASEQLHDLMRRKAPWEK